MADQAIIDLIAEKLRTGITHPGDRGKGTPPTLIPLPLGRRPGQPKEMGDLMDATANLLAEAVVHVIESDGQSEIVARTELRELRHAVGDTPIQRMLPVHCQCDTGYTDPLMVLTVSNPDCVVVNGPALIGGLAARTSQCPHGVVS